METCAASTSPDGISTFRLSPTIPGGIKSLVRREHTFGSDCIKTTNTAGYFIAGDDPARVTWFDDEMRY